VVLHDGDKSGVVETTAGNPGGKLAVPNQRVAVDLKLVLLGKRSNSVTPCEGEVVARGLCRLPFHSILGGDRVELLLNDLGLNGLVSDRQSSTNEVPSSSTERLEQTCLLASIALSEMRL
jgi:hypothetical protein